MEIGAPIPHSSIQLEGFSNGGWIMSNNRADNDDTLQRSTQSYRWLRGMSFSTNSQFLKMWAADQSTTRLDPVGSFVKSIPFSRNFVWQTYQSFQLSSYLIDFFVYLSLSLSLSIFLGLYYFFLLVNARCTPRRGNTTTTTPAFFFFSFFLLFGLNKYIYIYI